MNTRFSVQLVATSLIGCVFGLVGLFIQTAEAATPPGTGFVGSSYSTGSSCSSCSGGGSQPSKANFTVNFSIGMGQLLLGGAAGDFYISEITPSSALATPTALRYSGLSDSTDGQEVIVGTNNVILQVLAPQAFATVTTNTAFSYQINVYSQQAKGAWNGSTYAVTNGTANLIATWTIANPDTTNSFNRLQVTEVPSSGTSRSWTYSFNTTNGVWTLTEPDGSLQYVSQITDPVTTNLVQTFQIANAAGTVIYSHSQVYTNFSWGQALLTDSVGIGADAKVTQYAYYPDGGIGGFSASGSKPPLQSVINPDGSWDLYLGYDSQGRPTDILRSFDAPFGSYSGNETTYDYTPVDPDDDGSIRPNTARKTVKMFNGTAASLNYEVFKPGTRQSIQCLSPYASYNDAGNLVTTTTYYTNGDSCGMVKNVINPDGTMNFYSYGAGATTETNIVMTGQPDPAGNYIVDGTKSVTVTGSVGQMLFKQTWDIASGLLLSSDIYTDCDSYLRPQTVVHLDGSTNNTFYACCGVDSTIDRDGVLTQYIYDNMKRQVAGARLGITTTNVLNAVGQTLKSIRIGTDNSQIVMQQSAYDTAGRLVVQTNALNGKIIYAETNDATTGGLIRTTTYPDGGTRVEAYYLGGSLKSVTGTAVHPIRYEYGAETDVNGNSCVYTKEIKLLNDGTTDSSEWTKTYADMAGRTTEILYADYHYSQSFYNNQGQLWKQVDPDGVTTLYQYNGKGELAFTAVDMDRNDTIDFSGSDRITWTTNDVTTAHSTTVRRSRTYAWTQDGVDSSSLLSVLETSANGLNSWQTRYGEENGGKPVTNSATTSFSGSSRTTIASAPDGSYTLNTYAYGRLISSTRYDSSAAQIGGTTYAYDAHGRQYQVTDARNGTTTYGYNNADQVSSVVAPLSQTTTTLYDNSLRPYSVIQPDGTTVNIVYLLTGELGLQYGSRTYPVACSYDYAGRMQTMTNWSTFSSLAGARVTTWNYDGNRGWLTSKAYADGSGPSYGYTPAGRLASRVWVRGTTTSYAYDNAGSLTNIVYSDSTPSVTNSYDRLGRPCSIVCDGMTDIQTYNLANELLTEAFAGGALDGLSVTNGYDQYLRRTNLTALGSSVLSRTSYGYDNASRLQTVNDGNNDTATYSYLANSPLVSQILLKQSSTTRMTTTKSYDYLNRLTQTASTPSGTGVSPVSFNYTYNTANQRTKNTLVDGSYWIYQYDTLGQVTGGTKYFADGTLVPGQQFGYQFDDIGNRKQTTAGGDASGANRRMANYSANTLNQITSRDYPGTNDVVGVALATNSVVVNGQTAWRKGEYFWSTVKSNNTASAQWEGVSVVSGGNTNTGNVLVPQTPQYFTYDADGNLVSDGLWTNTWNAENRLVATESLTSVPSGGRMKEEWSYLPDGRWSQSIVSSWNGSAYVPQCTNKFVWDGKVLTAIIDQTNGLVMSFLRGTDLSGSMQGAGGVGGLLAVSFKTNGTHFAAFDGNGNVAALASATDSTITANYEYGPFGEAVRITGTVGKLNPIRFSTQFADDVTGDLKYLYRSYNTSTGKWANRDPIGERGGLNLYNFILGSPINFVDSLGLANTLPNPVIPPIWPSGSGPGGLAPISKPPPSGPGGSKPGSGSPVGSPRIPPSAPGGPEDGAAGGIAGGIELAGSLLNEGSKNSAFDMAYDACNKKDHSLSGQCFCCMMTLTRYLNGPNAYYYSGGYGTVQTTLCALMKKNPPPILIPITFPGQETTETLFIPW